MTETATDPSPADTMRAARAELGRLTRTDGRPVNQERFALLCGWSGSMQTKYESGRHDVPDERLATVGRIVKAARKARGK